MAEFRRPTRLANTIDGGLAGVILDICNQDPGAFLGKQFADGFADSVFATRNDRNLVFQSVHFRRGFGGGCYVALRIVSTPDVAGPAGSSGNRKILSAAWMTYRASSSIFSSRIWPMVPAMVSAAMHSPD